MCCQNNKYTCYILLAERYYMNVLGVKLVVCVCVCSLMYPAVEMDGDSLLKKSYSVGEEVAAVITQVTLHDMKYNNYIHVCMIVVSVSGCMV